MISSHPPDSPWFKRFLRGWPKRATSATSGEKETHSSNIQCQDLTAKQFAHLTGINLHQEDETYSLPIPHHPAIHTVRSSRTTASCKKPPRIWDHDFWQPEPCTYQKGRFKVCIGDFNDHDPQTFSPPSVLEWKRKRSQESATD